MVSKQGFMLRKRLMRYRRDRNGICVWIFRMEGVHWGILYKDFYPESLMRANCRLFFEFLWYRIMKNRRNSA